MEYNREDWFLRMEVDSFLILVNKHTNEYKNIYSESYSGSLNELAKALDKHPNLKE